MSSQLKLPLRILYTVNGNPQYVLARTPKAVAVDIVPTSIPPSTETPPRYATTSLKLCLETMCRSSPELIQDRSRDYSVYLLDPLEASAPAQSTSTAPSNGPPTTLDPTIAVSFGLMSWALSTDEADPTPVTGTVKTTGAGREMLELIFCLRQTIPVQRASLSDTVRSWSLPAIPSAAAYQYYYAPRPYTKANPSDQSLTRAGLYKTEAEKPKNRTAASKPAQQPPAKRPAPLPATAGPPPAGTIHPHLLNAVSQREQTASTNAPPQTNKDLIDLVTLIAMTGDEAERNKALQGVLALMHGDGGEARPELVRAMSLLSEIRKNAPPTPSTFSRSQSTPEGSALFRARNNGSEGDEIVPLNKENVNPTLLRKGTGDKGSSSAPGNSLPTAPSPLASLSQPSATRKRSWNEASASTEGAEARPHRPYYRELEQSENAPHNSSPGPSQPRGMPPPVRATISASSPVRALRRKPTPAWAVTNTALTPRLSEDTLQRVQEKQRQEIEAKKEERRRKMKESRQKGRIVSSPVRPLPPRPRPAVAANSVAQAPAPAPIAAATNGCFSIFGPQTPRRGGSVQPTDTTPKNNGAPCTPPRKRANTISTPIGANSLFTPASTSWESGRLLSFQQQPETPSRTSGSSGAPPPESDLLGRELDSAFKQLDASSHAMEEDDEETDEDVQLPPKQHWEGLPPSSPPPPSSPYLLPTLPREDDDIPTPHAVSEGEGDADADAEAAVLSEPEACASLDVLEQLFSPEVFPPPAEASDAAFMDSQLFEQFMHNLGSDDGGGVWTSETGNLEQLDFSEFFNVCEPILGAGGLGQDEVGDAAKAAAEMQSLFSGCLV